MLSHKVSRTAAMMLLVAMLLVANVARAEHSSGAEESPVNSPSMMYAGIALTAIGTASVIAGPILIVVGSGASSDSDSGFTGAGLPTVLAGYLLTGVGIASVGVGIPLWIVGASSPDDDEPEPEPGPRAEIVLGVGHAGLSVTW